MNRNGVGNRKAKHSHSRVLSNHPFPDNMLLYRLSWGTTHVSYCVLHEWSTDVLGWREHPASLGLIYFCLVEKGCIYLFNVLWNLFSSTCL